jgi:hypothetical protein
VLAGPQRGEAAVLGRPGDGADHERIGAGTDAESVEADAHVRTSRVSSSNRTGRRPTPVPAGPCTVKEGRGAAPGA